MTMNGAQALIRTLVDCGVDVCFMNPGTSEMHFVAALDDVPEMRGVLGLFEGVATGAADGYARMADRPAAVLLHLGPGLGNGLANLHNARKGKVPVVNIVGDHATYHQQYDAQLQSDIETVARNVSSWIRVSARPEDVAADAADAVVAAMGPPGQVATLILPADASWLPGGEPASRQATGRTRPGRVRHRRRPRRASCDGANPLPSWWVVRRAGLRPWWPPAVWRPPREPSCCARRSPPVSSEARAGHRSSASPTWPSSPLSQLAGADVTWSWSTPRHPSRSSPTPARRRTWFPTGARCTCWPTPETTPSARSRRWPTRSARRPARHSSRPTHAPSGPPAP